MTTRDYSVLTDTVRILLAAMSVLFMQPRFALCKAGCVRCKNTVNILFKHFVDTMLCSLPFGFVGLCLMFGNNEQGLAGLPIRGNLSFFIHPLDISAKDFVFLGLPFCAKARAVASVS